MDARTFAATRRTRLERADDELRPHVEGALDALGAGGGGWADELVLAASQLWLEVFEQESDGGNRRLALARFRRDLRESLEKTSQPDGEPSDGQVDRLTYWLSGYTVNSATTAGAFTRGIRFKRWVTMHDDAVRPVHILVDGQTVPIGGTFDVAGESLHYPGEPVGPPEVWIQCRCLAQPASRDGEVMSGTTYTIGPEDDVLDENPDIIPGEKVVTADAALTNPDGTPYTGALIVLMPAESDPIVAASSEPAHVTTVWFGELGDLPVDVKELEQAVRLYAQDLDGPVVVPVAERGTLGDDEADVAFLEKTDSLVALRDGLLANEPVKTAHDAVEQFPEWTPHVTLGYPDRPAEGEYDADSVTFDRIALWLGGEHFDYPMGGAMTAAATFDTAEVIADVDDTPDEDEELITEIPIHGVAAPEGVWTGDRRFFEVGATTWRDLPVPFLYQPVSVPAHDQAYVTGRIDKIWRDEENLIRYDGAIVLNRQYANEVIQGIIDGTVRGVSVDVDDVALNVTATQAEMDQAMSEFDETGIMRADPEVYSAVRIAGLTGVAIPAFQEGYIALGHTDEEGSEAAQALAACGCMQGMDLEDVEEFRDYTPEQRREKAENGQALPDGSFPIADCEDLANAIQAIGRASDPDAAKAHIRKRKSALGCDEVELPDTWSTDQGTPDSDTAITAAAFAPGTKDGPGWITHPVPTARIRRYWVRGEGAAKIRWGAPGDFNRCRAQLAKYVQNPDWLAGLCANMHKEALGIWPAQHAGKDQHALVASATRAPLLTLVAAGRRVYDASMFERVEMDRPVALRIEGRHIYGYIAEWGQCHIGIEGLCTTAEPSLSNYAWYKHGTVQTTAGERHVAHLTYGIGHANLRMRASAATAHYDQPEAVRAYVNVGEDGFGIWYSGALAPWVTDDDIDDMLSVGSLSGDWRDVRGDGTLEMIGAVFVAVPALPITPAIAASAGRQTALVGAGRLPKEEKVMAASANMTVKVDMDAETVAGIARAAVEEYRHQEKVEARATPARERIRAHRLSAARNKVKGA